MTAVITLINCLLSGVGCVLGYELAKLKIKIDVGEERLKSWTLWSIGAIFWLAYVFFVILVPVCTVRRIYPFNPANPERGLGWIFALWMLEMIPGLIVIIVTLVKAQRWR